MFIAIALKLCFRIYHQEGLEMNGTCGLQVYADNINIMGENINTMKKNTESVLQTSMEISVEVNS
jgi:hypothetical protein